jgi:ketosteroid isomerase-like protein
MAQSYAESLRARYEGLGKATLASAFEGVHPDFELKTATRVPNAGTYRGAEAATKFIEDLLEPFDEVTYTPQKFFEHRNQVVVYLLVHLHPPGSSSVVENQVGTLWTFRDGMPVRCEMFPKRELALEAAGMSEQDAVTA